MKSTLTMKDYKEILKYYNISYKSNNSKKNLSNRKIKIIAENILANKLCNCIQKVTKKNKVKEPGAIGICTKSIFHRKKIQYNKFTCKNKPKLVSNKKTRKKLTKMK